MLIKAETQAWHPVNSLSSSPVFLSKELKVAQIELSSWIE
jgi:hypothetical protein